MSSPASSAAAVQPQGPLAKARLTIAFFGEVLLALARWLRGRPGPRMADLLAQLDQTGPRSLPIVALSCALIGLMLAYMGGAQLGRIGAQNFLADVVTVGMVRELAGMMTAIILAGRVGSAFAAQLATMEAGEEIDALRVLGVDPVAHLVLPRLLALLLVAPALYAFGALAGVAAGWPAAVGVYGVSSAEYWHQCLRALTFTHLWIGLFKCMLYVALVALAGCREGLHAGRSAQAVGQATTTAVVKALVWIVTAACATTVVFTALGY
jgi:phospholipid/cholesterol/gamma-HCH transport system permease protein